jgi:malate dehydrogenase (oxaloacetate-decarboxylating)
MYFHEDFRIPDLRLGAFLEFQDFGSAVFVNYHCPHSCSPSYPSQTLAQEPPRVKIPEILIVETIHQPGSLASVLLVIAEAGLAIEHLTALRRDQGRTLWEITLEMDEEADRSLYERIEQLPNARFVGKSDRVFNRHRGGKIKTIASLPINTLQVLRDIYTPGVARVCLAIKQDPQAAHDFTNLDNTVAIVTNGTAVLGLGNIGPLAGLPVMEGKAALFADLVGISGVPILLNETAPDRIVDLVAAMELSFGAIQLEDIAAPECFEIEQKLRERIAKPVLHDDQHGTAVVALAALTNAARQAGRSLRGSVVGQIGLGAAGTGIVRLLRAYGVERVLGADRSPDAIARLVAMGGEGASLEEIMARADIVIATTGVKGLIKPEWVRPGQVILALSNPDPEIEPLIARERGAAFAADGKGINNVLAFPGLFKGALSARVTGFSDAMLMAAAEAIAQLARGDELVPDPLDKNVHERVAAAVREAATEPMMVF